MTDKVALITGSAKRIGACTAKHLHQSGYQIVVHCQHSLDEAKQLAGQLNQQRQDSCKVVTGDLSELNQIQRVADEAQSAFGRLDVLINNASSFFATPFGTITPADWHSLVGSNMMAPLFLSQHCYRQLEQHQGVIINMVDIHAERPLKDHTVYCMAKAALIAMTRSLAQDLAPRVRVNGVAPGAILWPEQSLSDEEKEQILSGIPAARCGRPEDIAEAILFLISNHYITGQVVAIDGGRSIASNAKA